MNSNEGEPGTTRKARDRVIKRLTVSDDAGIYVDMYSDLGYVDHLYCSDPDKVPDYSSVSSVQNMYKYNMTFVDSGAVFHDTINYLTMTPEINGLLDDSVVSVHIYGPGVAHEFTYQVNAFEINPTATRANLTSLIAEAESLNERVSISDTGKDVADGWGYATRTAFDQFTSAIEAARAASSSSKDNYQQDLEALESAIDSFTDEVKVAQEAPASSPSWMSSALGLAQSTIASAQPATSKATPKAQGVSHPSAQWALVQDVNVLAAPGANTQSFIDMKPTMFTARRLL